MRKRTIFVFVLTILSYLLFNQYYSIFTIYDQEISDNKQDIIEPVIFYHLRKVGGTTLRGIFSFNYLGIYDRTTQVINNKSKNGWNNSVYYGHWRMPVKKIIDMFFYHGIKNIRIVVWLRNPVDRVRSRYFWFRALQFDKHRCIKGRNSSLYDFALKYMEPYKYFNSLIAGFDAGKCNPGQMFKSVSGSWKPLSDVLKVVCPKIAILNNPVESIYYQISIILNNQYTFIGITEEFDASLVLMKYTLNMKSIDYWVEKKVRGVSANLTIQDQIFINDINFLDHLVWLAAKNLLKKRLNSSRLTSSISNFENMQKIRNNCVFNNISTGEVCSSKPSIDYKRYTEYKVPKGCESFFPCINKNPCGKR